jgi:cytochrome c553
MKSVMKVLVMMGAAIALSMGMGVSAFAEGEESGAGEGANAIDVVALWKKHCASCHGADGKGQTKAGRTKKVEDLTNPEIRAKFDRERMIQATKEGVKDDAGKERMKPYAEKLSDAEIAALTDYVIDTLK